MTESKVGERQWLHWAAFACIAVLAIALRVVGLRWGLPNELHSYSYHPDEFLTIGSSARMAGLLDGHRTINPGLYNYPSLYLYISALSMMVGSGYGWLGSSGSAYLAARIVTVLMSIGAVGATYWAGRVLFGNTAGLLAALILAIAPLHVQHSHFATVDVPSTLFVALCLGFSGLILKRGTRRDYILAGVMAGLACGTKYNAVLVILAPIAAHFLSEAQPTPSPLRERVGVRVRGWNAALRPLLSANLWLIPLCAIAAFIISTPGSVLYTQQFLHGISYEMQHQSAGHGLVFAGTGNGFVYTLFGSLASGLSPLLMLVFAAAVMYGLAKREKGVFTALAFALPYYVLISCSQVRFARYTLPLFPVAALLAGWLIQDLYTMLSTRGAAFGRLVLVSCSTLLLMNIAGYTCLLNSAFRSPDPRDSAARWVTSHVPAGSAIGVLDYPWFYSPPFSKDIGLGTLDQRKEAAKNAPYRIVLLSDEQVGSQSWIKVNPPRWVITSDYETGDAFRLENERSISPPDARQVASILGNMDIIYAHYRTRGMFGRGRFLSATLGVPLPHDMRYAMPEITIYELKK